MKPSTITLGVISLVVLLLTSSTAVQASEPHFVLQVIGETGTDAGQLDAPIDVELFDDQYYVVDRSNDRIQIFDKAWNYVDQFGGGGTGNGNFDFPYAIASNGTHYFVADSFNNRIQVFNSNHGYVDQFGVMGTTNGEFDFPIHVMVHEDRIFVSDYTNDRVQSFNMSTLEHINNYGVSGSAEQLLDGPIGTLALGGKLYVVDRVNGMIKAYDLETSQYYRSFPVEGNGPGEFNGIWSIDFVNNHFVVSDEVRDLVSVYDKYGEFKYDIDYRMNGATGFYINDTTLITPEFSDDEISILKLVPDPENISTRTGLTAITLTWEVTRETGATPVEYYNIYRHQGDGFEYLGSADYSSYTDSAVLPNTDYTYAIEAVSLIGKSNMVSSSAVALNSNVSVITDSGDDSTSDGFLSELPEPILPLFASLALLPLIRRKLVNGRSS